MKKLLLLLCSFWLLSTVGLMAQVRVPFTMDSDIFYGAYVNTYGKYNYDWESGQIRMSSDGLLNEGCGFCWDDRYFTVEIEGGEHTVRWIYRKGRSGSDGEDALFLDNVTWAPVPVVTLGEALDALELRCFSK